ncbi:unnamed protein product [Polarella glacialis]|uniref:Radical SAM core domain-containing protein n=1 Tax=Polarella glacialis TaxID=89957 RepID=A0A813DMH7_POLGL|nr:unnamed protein product [Polarella glacialis]
MAVSIFYIAYGQGRLPRQLIRRVVAAAFAIATCRYAATFVLGASSSARSMQRAGCRPGRIVVATGPDLYVEPVFRPPAEAANIILQVTNGCSWNRCTYCEMYTAEQKAFRAKSPDEIRSDLEMLKALHKLEAASAPPRVFLADGDAMTLPTARLREILSLVREAFPDVARVSSYCLPRNIRGKSVEDLAELRHLGLRTLYVGCESGDDEILQRVGKGETSETSFQAIQKIREAGLKSSVMILHGLGGRQLSRQHAVNSAKLMNAAQPDFLSTLVVSFPLGRDRFAAGFEDGTSQGFQELSPEEVIEEMSLFVTGLELRRTIFRSDHASNYLALQGVLGRDKKRLILELDAARAGLVELRPEWARGL